MSRRSLGQDLPADPYPPEVFDAKVQAVYDHVLAAYGDDGSSVYAVPAPPTGGASASVDTTGPLDVDRISDAVIERIHTDPQFAADVAAQFDARGRQA